MGIGMNGPEETGGRPSTPLHVPVLLETTLELLAPALDRPRPSTVVDATLGLGGHAEELLTRFPRTTLIGVDRDPAALRLAGERLAPFGARFRPAHAVYDAIPAVLDDLGLVAALEWQAGEFERRSGVPCVLDVRVAEDDAIPDPTATAVFRVFQEALTNVARHARATRVTAELSRADGRLVLRVADDGVGIAPGDAGRPGTMGLAGMRERASALRGEVTVRPGERGGTVVTLAVPAPAPAAEAHA